MTILKKSGKWRLVRNGSVYMIVAVSSLGEYEHAVGTKDQMLKEWERMF